MRETKRVQRVAVEQLQILVLADDGESASTTRRGRLFEQFVARLLEALGYNAPSPAELNVSSSGIEIDVTAAHRLSGSQLIAECKAYTQNVPAHMLDSFYGKLTVERFQNPDLHGLFVALPGMTGPGVEQASAIKSEDTAFTYLDAGGVRQQLEDLGLVTAPPSDIGLTSDPMVLITENGIFQAALRLDSDTRTGESIVVWSTHERVPDPVIELIQQLPVGSGLPVVDLTTTSAGEPTLTEHSHFHAEPQAITQVAASSSDFEYQFPTAPKFFVGRKDEVASALSLIKAQSPNGIVLNAQSGWGKSSLALRLAHETRKIGGAALSLDARTATSPSYVPLAIQTAATQAADIGLLDLPSDAAFASVASALATLKRATWHDKNKPVLVFFDQFENVFRDEALTRAFRDLSLSLREVDAPIKVGYAWKTDLVGWTEGHPYHLRDEIRGASSVITLRPLGADEISLLLTRLQKVVGVRLDRDLRDRLREYSGGLPWLFKKLAGHVIAEIGRGVTQEQLLQEALNVQGLFDADLAQLNPDEVAALRRIAQLAPAPIEDLSDQIDSSIVQSLLDRRLIVQVGERLDTYWDIFRDYLNTGSVPIKEGFILRLNPSQSMGQLLRDLLAKGGKMSVADAMAALKTSEAVVFNTVRDLRLVGLVSYQPGTIRLPAGVEAMEDVESELRARAALALRRHRVYDMVNELLDESTDGTVEISKLARALARTFPAVNARPATWDQYARAFAYWLAYARLFGMTPSGVTANEEDTAVDLSLLTRSGRVSVSGAFPQSAAGPAVQLGRSVASGEPNALNGGRLKKARAALVALGFLHPGDDAEIRGQVFGADGAVDRGRLREVLEERVAGAKQAIELLESKPDASPIEVGMILREAQGTSWTPSSVRNAGKHFRSWAREAGVSTSRHARAARNEPKLFE